MLSSEIGAAEPMVELLNRDSCVTAVSSPDGLQATLCRGQLLIATNDQEWIAPILERDLFHRGLAYGNGQFVVVGGSYINGRGVIYTSRNGIHWTRRRSIAKNVLHAVAFGNDLFVAVGDAGAVFTSGDGVEWKRRASRTTESLAAIAFGNGIFIATGECGRFNVSTNGTLWTTGTLNRSEYLGRTSFRNDTFIASGFRSVFSTTNGVNWKESPLARATAAPFKTIASP